MLWYIIHFYTMCKYITPINTNIYPLYWLYDHRIINRIADIVYQCISGCMTAQVRAIDGYITQCRMLGFMQFMWCITWVYSKFSVNYDQNLWDLWSKPKHTHKIMQSWFIYDSIYLCMPDCRWRMRWTTNTVYMGTSLTLPLLLVIIHVLWRVTTTTSITISSMWW